MSITLTKAIDDNHWLGDVQKVHSIAEFSIVEYTVDRKRWPRTEFETGFAGYINGKSVGETWSSLDKALIGLVCRKHDGANSRAAYYIFDMLRMPGETIAMSPPKLETPDER